MAGLILKAKAISLLVFAEETRASTFFSAAVSLGLRFVRVILFSSHALQFLSIAPFRRIFVKFFCFAAGEFRSLFLFQIEINVENLSRTH